MTPTEYKKIRNEITDLKLHCAELYKAATAHRQAIKAQEQVIKQQAQQITGLKQIVSQLYFQVQFSENENINYDEAWLKKHTGFYQSKNAQN